jgi:hypothetical protein
MPANSGHRFLPLGGCDIAPVDDVSVVGGLDFGGYVP